MKILTDDAQIEDYHYFDCRGHRINTYKHKDEYLISINSYQGETILPIYFGRTNRFFTNLDSAIKEGEKIIDTYIKKGYLS